MRKRRDYDDGYTDTGGDDGFFEAELVEPKMTAEQIRERNLALMTAAVIWFVLVMLMLAIGVPTLRWIF